MIQFPGRRLVMVGGYVEVVMRGEHEERGRGIEEGSVTEREGMKKRKRDQQSQRISEVSSIHQ
jgi:hypothetical protein